MSLSIIKYPSSGGGGGTVTGATNGLSLSGTNVVLGQNIGQVGNPATLLSDREIPLNGNDLIINGDGAIKYSFQPFFFSIGDLPDRNAQFSARAAAFVNLDPVGTALVSVSRGAAVLQMVMNGTGLGGHAELHATTLLHVGTLNNSDVNIITNNLERITVLGSNGNVGIRTTNPTAQLHLPAGATGATNAPLKFTTGSLMTSPETGAVEFDGTHFYGTIGSTRYQLDQQSGTQGLDSVLAQNQTLTANRLVNLGAHNIQFVNGFIGIQIAPTAHLHLAGAGVTPGNAPLKFATGSLLTTAEVGAVEYNGTNLYFTPIGTDRRIVGLVGRNAQSGTTYAIVLGDFGKIVGLSNIAARTVTLPAANTIPSGYIVWVKDEAGTAATDNITVNRTGADTIDGATSDVIISNYGVHGYYSNGTSAWFIV